MEIQNQYSKEDKSVISVGEWLITMLIMIIPLVNVIMLFVWAFGNDTAKTKSNWAKAQLIWMAIGIILAFLLWGTIAALIIGSSR